ncbi:hypothetical protein [Corallococcus sp. bb12-1]|uniref:hypothetical protein n=1 Tax=Corallococcus sp. bb12-1 TaxID=2996784 RepID=UPI00226EA5A0|nr:hypothetical protein [Corallococcus sp. bb12-1]
MNTTERLMEAEPAMSAEAVFITQYNPKGPRGSTHRGPASLAMSLAYTGHRPPGLTFAPQLRPRSRLTNALTRAAS